MLVLGYAGWSPKQLESEIETGSWIVVPATKQLVFDTDNETKWNVALSSLGLVVLYWASALPVTSHLTDTSYRTIVSLLVGGAAVTPLLVFPRRT